MNSMNTTFDMTGLRTIIDGAAVDPAGPKIAVTAPATGQTLVELASVTAEETTAAIAAASRAARSWKRTTPARRAELLLEIAETIDSHATELAHLESINVGKPLAAAVEEVEGAADCFRFFAGAARNLEGKAAAEYTEGYTSLIRREPIGVAGLISAWNYPLMITAWKLGAALAAGNTVVLKPATQTPLTALRLTGLVRDAAPAGVINTVFGTGTEAGDALVTSADIGIVSMTGGTPTGRRIAARAADSLKRVHLELGGKAPVVVFGDADPARVADVLRVGSFWNSGQDCGAAARVYAHRSVYDKLLEELVDRAESLSVGDPQADPDVEMGPVAYAAHQRGVLELIEQARADGVTVATGGHALGERGAFVAPTVLTGVANDHRLAHTEVFGPVVDVQPFDDDTDVFGLANDTPYGLAASVFTRDIGLAMQASRDLDFGTVWVNDHMPMAAEMPWGGFRASGYGKDQSMYSLEDYTQVKHVMINLE